MGRDSDALPQDAPSPAPLTGTTQLRLNVVQADSIGRVIPFALAAASGVKKISYPDSVEGADGLCALGRSNVCRAPLILFA